MQNPRQLGTILLTATAVAAALAGSLFVGFSPLVTGGLVLLAFAGSTVAARGITLLRGMALVKATAVPTLSVDEISKRGRAHAANFRLLSERITDPNLRVRVEHIGQRLDEVFTEMVGRPEAMDDMDAVSHFVQNYLPRATVIIDRYVALVSKFDEKDTARIADIVKTINQVADTVKTMHRGLVNHELAEFAEANLSLQVDLELDNPTLRAHSRHKEST